MKVFQKFKWQTSACFFLHSPQQKYQGSSLLPKQMISIGIAAAVVCQEMNMKNE
jgi:hypothetical protein